MLYIRDLIIKHHGGCRSVELVVTKVGAHRLYVLIVVGLMPDTVLSELLRYAIIPVVY